MKELIIPRASGRNPRNSALDSKIFYAPSATAIVIIPHSRAFKFILRDRPYPRGKLLLAGNDKLPSQTLIISRKAIYPLAQKSFVSIAGRKTRRNAYGNRKVEDRSLARGRKSSREAQSIDYGDIACHVDDIRSSAKVLNAQIILI